MLQHKALLCTVITIILVVPHGTSIRIYNSIAEVLSNDLVPRGSTVVLVCTETPTPQQVDYQWTCPKPPCDEQYGKVYGNVLVVVATPAAIGQYSCSPTPGSGAATRTLSVQVSLFGDQLNIYNNSSLLLQNTLFTSPEGIWPNGLTCTKRSDGVVPWFRRESDSTKLGTSSSSSTTVPAESLQPNGIYWCQSADNGEVKREFFIYFNNAILPTPQVSVGNTTTDQHLHLLLTTPPPYNSGRFILRYDCTLGDSEADIEVEYRSVDPEVNSDTVVTRSRSCFVVGEISRVTVWFVNGENISTTPAVVDVDSTNIPVSGTTTSTTSTSPTSTATTSTTSSTSTGTTTTTSSTSTGTTTKVAAATASSDSSTQIVHPSNQPTPTGTHSKDNNNHVLYIGSGAGCLLLVLVVVLAVIICCVVAVHRRGKRSRSTDHTPTLHYYSTPGHEQEEEPQVQIGADNYDTVVEKTASFTLGTLYDEIEVKPVKSKPVAVPSEYQLVEAIKEDDKEAHNTVTISERFYAQPDMTVESNKKGEKGTTAGVEDPDVLYAEVDKPKKKKKKGKEKKEEQPQGDLYAVVDKTSKKKGKEKKAKEKEKQGDEDLYTEVNKTQKKGKKCQKDNESNSFRKAAVELDSPPPVPDRGLIYEPSADREASDQEQQHHQQQLQQQQQQQQQEPEQQQQQLQKQKHEEGVEKQELQEQENIGPEKPSLN